MTNLEQTLRTALDAHVEDGNPVANVDGLVQRLREALGDADAFDHEGWHVVRKLGRELMPKVRPRAVAAQRHGWLAVHPEYGEEVFLPDAGGDVPAEVVRRHLTAVGEIRREVAECKRVE